MTQATAHRTAARSRNSAEKPSTGTIASVSQGMIREGTVLGGEVDGIEQSIRWLVERLPAHGDHLARYCPAPA